MNPNEIFAYLYKEANSDAVALATVDEHMQPSARMVLLKHFDSNGLVFFTNLNSRKAKDLSKNNKAALLFFWPQLGKQVRVEGNITQITDKAADEYFASRERDSQIGTWASRQSEPMRDHLEIDEKVTEFKQKFTDQKNNS